MTEWSKHVHRFAKKHNMSYKQANVSKKCKEAYKKRKTSPRKKTSPRRRKKTSPRRKRLNPPTVLGPENQQREVPSSRIRYNVGNFRATPDQNDLIDYARNLNAYRGRLTDPDNMSDLNGIITTTTRDGNGQNWNARVEYEHPNYYYVGHNNNNRMLVRLAPNQGGANQL